jgi:single-strand DNA-binding protein
MQKILIIGYLGRYPELKYPQGAVVAQFSIASTERWKNKNGELQEVHRVVRRKGVRTAS